MIALAQRLGTPLYVHDLNAVAARAQALRAELPAASRLYVSLKANPLPALVRELRTNGCHAELTSDGELTAALAAGFKGEELLLGGPGKTLHEIQAAIAAGVRGFSCESRTDLQRLGQCAATADVQIDVLLRVNPADAPDARMAMAGVESQFGFDEPSLLGEKLTVPANVTFRGVHVYFGTQVASRDAIIENTKRALAAAARVSTAQGFRCEIVNAGGGFAWPYAVEGEGPDFTGMRAALDAVHRESSLPDAALWFESGRHLVASSGTLLTTVLDVKRAGSKTFIVLDTGIHHLGGMSGLGRIPRPVIAVRNLTREPATTAQVDIVGPLCSPLDSLARGITIPLPEVGDVLAIPNVGAYGLSASLIGFLSHSAPKEVSVRGTEVIETWQLRTGHQRLDV
jgi:diaminopimelate decarboxylase